MSVEATSYYDSLVSKGPSTTTTKGGNELTSTDFLTLLLAQMQHQDPTEPMDTSQMVDQMTQYSQLSTMSEINGKMDTLAASIDSMASSYGLEYLGKKIEARGYTLNKSGENISDMYITLDGDAANLTVNIYDSTGKIVDSRLYSDVEAGTIAFEWDGLDYKKNTVADGNYYVFVSATDADGAKLTTSTTTTGTVTGVSQASDGVWLTLADGRTVKMSNVTYCSQ